MKATADFNWIKILCFYGTGILALLAFAILAAGIILITKGNTFNGIAAILGAVATFAWAVYLYKYYQKLDAADKPGVKLEDVTKEDRR